MISEERKEVNKQKIIEVSTKLFAENGIPMTTIAQIAKEAGVVDRTVLNIFGSKNNLVLEDVTYISNIQIEHMQKLIVTPEYIELCGLEQIMLILKERGKTLKSKPHLLLLLSEVKVWVSRSFHDDKIIENYMKNLNFLFDIMGNSIDKGLEDGSINKAVDKKQALSILVPVFRSVLQQLAQVKMNPAFNRCVDVDEEFQIQLNLIYSGLVSKEKLLLKNHI